MLEVQKFLKEAEASDNPLELLKVTHGIKYSIWEGQLCVLNYDQINSPKVDPITIECRSLVLELGTWEVISRSFDRFFNLGENDNFNEGWVTTPSHGSNRLRTMKFHEKMDGSLIGVFLYKGNTLYRTRSVIMPEGEINGTTTTWKDAIESCLQLEGGQEHLLASETWICELTCRENRIVVNYGTEPRLTLLAIRNTDGSYEDEVQCDFVAYRCGFSIPRTYAFSTREDCVNTVKDLPNLEEGYVGYNPAGVPCVKVKNPAYVAAHHLRGDVLNEKRILDLIIMKEAAEYLAIFPEDKDKFAPYIKAYDAFTFTMHSFVGFINSPQVKAKTQKDFALFFKDFPEACMIFPIRQGVKWSVTFDKLSSDKKRSLVLGYRV